MTTIQVEPPVCTLVNVFAVNPENEQKLIDLLVKAVEHTMKQLPGFISSNLHKSYDARQVVNYVELCWSANCRCGRVAWSSMVRWFVPGRVFVSIERRSECQRRQAGFCLKQLTE